jgi:tetratricopeptide (TPR) repeat protein
LLAVYDAQCIALAPKVMEELERRIAEKPNSELDTMLRPEDKREATERQKLREQAGGYMLQRALLHFLLESQTGSASEMRKSFAVVEALCERTGAKMPAVLAARRFARNRDSGRALTLVRRALTQDPDDWQALALGAQLHLEGKRYQAALDMAMRSLSLVYHQPLMHYVMGYCLMNMGDMAGAEQPLRLAVSQSPGFTKAHELLSRLYADHLDRPKEAALHYVNAEQLKKTRREKRKQGTKETELEEPEEDELEVEDAPIVRPVFPHRAGRSTPDRDRKVVIVCGLPRSGTSMLMQLLVAGGVEPLTDGLREADEDNPRGYYEYERATHLHEDRAWLPEARGKVVKLVLPLVPFLPRTETYRLILIQRDLTVVVASQEKMLSRLGRAEQAANLSAEALMREYCAQEHRVLNWLEARPGIAILPLNYDAILRDPTAAAEAVAAFLGRDFDATAAAQAVDPTLKRQTGKP